MTTDQPTQPEMAIARHPQRCPWISCPQPGQRIEPNQVIGHFPQQKWMHWDCCWLARGLAPQVPDYATMTAPSQEALLATTVWSHAEPPRTKLYHGTRDELIAALKRAEVTGRWVQARFHRRAPRGRHYEIEEPVE